MSLTKRAKRKINRIVKKLLVRINLSREDKKMFKPKAIYFEKEIINYPLGKELMEEKIQTKNLPI